MRVLLAYKTTGRTMGRLLKTLALQSQLSMWGAEFTSVIVTDKETEVPSGHTFLREDLWRNGKLSYSSFRNAAFYYAEVNRFDWVIDAGADSAFLGVVNVPSSGVARIPTYYAHASDTPDSILKGLSVPGGLSFGLSSYLLVSRKVFTTTRFNTSFRGYGWEDRDYIENVLPFKGYKLSETIFRAIHMWHPTEERRVNPEDFERNRQLYVRRQEGR